MLITIFQILTLQKIFAYETSSPYWSTYKNGPVTMDQAIEMFFKGRPLDPIEGIWTESNWGLVAITKDGNVYKKYVISVQYSGLNGTHETTYLRTASPDEFTFFTRIVWKTSNPSDFKFKTSPGTLILKNNNFAEREIDQYALNPSGTFTRNWPLDLYAHNSQFKSNKNAEDLPNCSFWKAVNKYDNCVGEYKYEDGTYKGAFIDGVPNGKGQFSNDKGEIYIGDFVNFKFEGLGTLKIENGQKYSGEFKNGEFHGNGILEWPNGQKYIGEFLEGKMNGEGQMNWPDGGSHVGGYQNDLRHGYGKQKWPDGSIYEGQYLNGIKHGSATAIHGETKNKLVGEYIDGYFAKGTIYYSNGDVNIGEWDKNHKQQGKGEFTWKDGSKYIGNFKDGDMTGYGELFYKNGDKYEGDFLNNKAHGVGTITWKDGQTYQGEWKNDIKEGMGKITWPSGASSYGPFKNNLRHGTHDYTYKDGTKKKILYNNGKKVE